eukprot:8165-Heterococcus_DN1.PRE.5
MASSGGSSVEGLARRAQRLSPAGSSAWTRSTAVQALLSTEAMTRAWVCRSTWMTSGYSVSPSPDLDVQLCKCQQCECSYQH